MTKSKIALMSFAHAIALLAYIIIIVLIMTHVGNAFQGHDGPWEAVPILLLVVLSAAISGIIVFARPIILFLSGKKREAIEFLAYTLGWIFVLLIIVLSIALTFFR